MEVPGNHPSIDGIFNEINHLSYGHSQFMTLIDHSFRISSIINQLFSLEPIALYRIILQSMQPHMIRIFHEIPSGSFP